MAEELVAIEWVEFPHPTKPNTSIKIAPGSPVPDTLPAADLKELRKYGAIGTADDLQKKKQADEKQALKDRVAAMAEVAGLKIAEE